MRREARNDLANRPDVVHVLVRIEVTRAHAMIDTALPLRLQFFLHRVAILTAEPQAVAGQTEIEHTVTVAEGPPAQNRLTQRFAVGQIEVQTDPPFEHWMA